MANTQHTQGPGQRVFSIGQRIVTLLVEMVETRLRLVVVELEEEKANLFQLLIMTGLTLLFAAFGLMSLLVLVIWAVDAQYRLHVKIQQQRLELSACRRHWHEATAPLDRGWHTLLSLRSWLMVGSGLMAVWSVRHPHFLMRWTKRGLGLWSTWRLVRGILRQSAVR